MTESFAARLLAQLAGDSDERVSRWAQTINRRCQRREINQRREIERLLAPFVAAGFVAPDACSLTPDGDVTEALLDGDFRLAERLALDLEIDLHCEIHDAKRAWS